MEKSDIYITDKGILSTNGPFKNGIKIIGLTEMGLMGYMRIFKQFYSEEIEMDEEAELNQIIYIVN